MPHCREVGFDLVGVPSPRMKKFTVDAIYPNEPLPPMNPSAIAQLVKALRSSAVDRIGLPVDGIVADIIDWES